MKITHNGKTEKLTLRGENGLSAFEVFDCVLSAYELIELCGFNKNQFSDCMDYLTYEEATKNCEALHRLFTGKELNILRAYVFDEPLPQDSDPQEEAKLINEILGR